MSLPALPLILKSAVIGFVVITALRALGIGLITIVGGYALVTAIENAAKSQLQSVPADIQSVMGLLRVDLCVNIIIAGVALRLTIATAKRLGVL